MRFTWPNGAKCAVALSFEYDAESVELGLKRSISISGDYGGFAPRFGVPRILELLDRYKIRGTFFVPGWDAEHYPDSVRDITAAEHEIAAHGYMHEDFSKLEEQEEKEVFEKAHQILTEITGISPRGFRNAAYGRPISPKTLSFARDLGYIYDSSYLDDDVPYLVKIDGKEVDMVEIPWAGVLNDMTFVPVKPMTPGLGLVLPARTSRWVLEMWKEEFDSLYEDVGFFTLVVHPTSMGWGSRIPIMEGIIRFIRGYPDVWFATYNEVAEICLQQLKK